MDGPAILVPLFAIGGFFMTLSIFIYLYFSTRHRERMALIDTGQDASIFNEEHDDKLAKSNNLKWGLVGVAVGLGLVVGNFLDAAHLMDDDVSYLASTLIAGGAALIFYYNKIAWTDRYRD